MKEILFRGQTRRYGEKVRMGDGFKLPSRWVYGGVLQGVGAHSIIYGGENADDPGDGMDKWCVYTDTLGQFTGLTDKNGSKIFEGDICTFDDEMMVVEWHDEDAMFFLLSLDGTNWTTNFSMVSGKELEAIGNIHDNPELMEVHE